MDLIMSENKTPTPPSQPGGTKPTMVNNSKNQGQVQRPTKPTKK